MPCQDCTPVTPVVYPSYLYSPGCNNDCTTSSAAAIGYQGPNLTCASIHTNDSIEVALQKIDQKLCVTTGSYAGFNFSCLPNITGEQSFVEGISAYACSIRSDLTTFTGTTFPAYQAALNTRIGLVEKPNLTGCSYLTFTSTESLQTVLNRIAARVCTIHTTELDISGVTWNSCLTVNTPPTTIGGAFQLLADQVCAINSSSSSVTLPAFNNTGTCLPSPGSADSLVDTVEKVKTRLCQTGTFDINALTWGCLSKPSSTATDLQGAFQTLLNTAVDYVQNKLTFSPDFIVDSLDEDTPCLGKSVTLATPLNQDRLVASTTEDDSPGVLADKLEAGTNITLDSTTTPGKVIIASSGSASDGKVKVDGGDTADYLGTKLVGDSDNGITISTSVDGTTIRISPSINMTTFVGLLLDELELNSTLKTRLCQINASCPSPCSQPDNVQAIIVT